MLYTGDHIQPQTIDPVFEEAVRACMARAPADSFPSRVEWIGIGWLVSVESMSFRASRKFEDMVVGGSFLYCDGRIAELSGARSLELQIVAFARAQGVDGLLLPWVRERASEAG